MKRNAFRIVGTDPENPGRLVNAGASATREAAEKRAGQWSRSKRMKLYAPYRVMTDGEYQAARGAS